MKTRNNRRFSQDRFCLATFAPCFPSAVRTFFGKCAMVLFFRAALTALFMFFLAARVCFSLGIVSSHFHDSKC
jgi:hypothetical protein